MLSRSSYAVLVLSPNQQWGVFFLRLAICSVHTVVLPLCERQNRARVVFRTRAWVVFHVLCECLPHIFGISR